MDFRFVTFLHARCFYGKFHCAQDVWYAMVQGSTRPMSVPAGTTSAITVIYPFQHTLHLLKTKWLLMIVITTTTCVMTESKNWVCNSSQSIATSNSRQETPHIRTSQTVQQRSLFANDKDVISSALSSLNCLLQKCGKMYLSILYFSN